MKRTQCTCLILSFLLPWFGQGAGQPRDNPVLHGWVKALRLINYLLALPKIAKHKIHLEILPVCTGVEVQRGLTGIEEFYSIISRESVKLNGFLDLSGMAAAAGYKLRARNMNAMGVQVFGTVLNKNVLTGDYL